MLQDVGIRVVSPNFEEDIVRPVSLIQQFFHNVLILFETKTNGTFLTGAAGITFNVQAHTQFDAKYNFMRRLSASSNLYLSSEV